MPREGWKSISLPSTLVKDIEQMMKERPFYWTSKADFVIDAVRFLIKYERRMEKLRQKRRSGEID